MRTTISTSLFSSLHNVKVMDFFLTADLGQMYDSKHAASTIEAIVMSIAVHSSMVLKTYMSCARLPYQDEALDFEFPTSNIHMLKSG